MLKKPAVLLVEKAGGKVETIAGELGEIYSAARELRNETNDSGNPDSILRIMALSGRGVRAEYKFKDAIRSQPVESETVIDNGEGGEGGEGGEAEAKELRKILRDAGVSYSPRAGLDHLRKQVAELKGE